MKRLVLVLGILFGFIQAKSQWIPVRNFTNSGSSILYLNATGNNEYQYIRNVYSRGKYTLKSGTIYSDGTLGSEYTYPIRADRFCTIQVCPDTTIIYARRPHFLGSGYPDTIQLAVLPRNQVILNFSPPIYIVGFSSYLFKLNSKYIASINDSVNVLNISNLSVIKKYRSVGARPYFNSYFYNNGLLCAQYFGNYLNNSSIVQHANSDPLGNTLTYNSSDRFVMPARIDDVERMTCNENYQCLRTSNDSITFYNFSSGQLVQKINSKNYFFRNTIDPPIPMVAGGTKKVFSVASNPDSIYFVNGDSYPYRKTNGQHRIYHFNRANATYELVDSAYIDNIVIKGMHIKNRQVITVDDQSIIYIKQFPLSTPNVSIQPQLIIYPNPVQEMLGVKGFAEGSTYIIHNALGSICKEGIAMAEIDVASLNSGFYRLTLRSQIGTYSTKFVKR